MISYLKGKIILKKDKFVILNVNGVGYKIFISEKTRLQIPKENEELEIFCFLSARESGMELYGFLNYEELEFFQVLESISGVGPKAALEIASLGPLENFKKEIEEGNTQVFEKIPGIGKKKAQKIILELSGKLKEALKERKKGGEEDGEACQALVNLGFSRQEAKNALSKVAQDKTDTKEKVKEALKILGH